MSAWAIMALNAALFGGGCFLVADLVTRVAGEMIEPDAVDPAPAARVAATGAAPAAAPSLILDRNLFGAQLAGEVQVSAPVDVPLEKTKLPLRLLGTAAATVQSRSRAAIENEKTRKHLVVAVGDRLEGFSRVRVDKIERTRVVLDNAGRPEELLLREDQPVPQARRARPAPRNAARRRPTAGNSVRDRLQKIAGEGGDGISKLLSQARISPDYDDNGELLGMKVDAIKSGSVFQSAGLQNGDVITEVNGIVIDRQEATPAVLEELMNAESIEIAAQRGGSSIRLSAEASDLVEQR